MKNCALHLGIAIPLLMLVELHGQQAENPMGKTWVVFIENSSYDKFPSLKGTARDVDMMKAALNPYAIDRVIHKQDLTREQLERFVSVELKLQLKTNRVNSLLIWYAGHGKLIHQTSFWIPIDAQRDNERSYYNTSKLKEALKDYMVTIQHLLVVTDACESGPTFYQAMRSVNTNRSCGKQGDSGAKSSQVFTASGYDLAASHSQFTAEFARALSNNTASCIPIENIVLEVNTALVENQQKKPTFGKITGIDDENGTFFFVGK